MRNARSRSIGAAPGLSAESRALLPYFHMLAMIIHMKTTLIIPDELMRTLKRRAATQERTLSDVVAEALQRGLASPGRTAAAALPVHRMGRPTVDLADRDALYRAMEED